MLETYLPTPHGRFARVLPHLLAQHPSLGREWHVVLESNPSAMTPNGGSDRLWVLVNGRPRLLPETILEVTSSLPDEAADPGC